MIAAIADDFTGAAEIGGIGLRCGYRTVISTSVMYENDCDLLIIATNIRAMDETSALHKLDDILNELIAFSPKTIFLKLDSVFRGHIKIMLQNAMDVLKLKKALFIPANPSLERIIRKGVYYYHGQPLMKSAFFSSKTIENNSSHVFDLIGKTDNDKIFSASVGDELLEGVVIGNATTEKDLKDWTDHLNEKLLTAGGSSFFKALLKSIPINKNYKSDFSNIGVKRFYICGSAHPYSKKAIQQAIEDGAIVHFMPKKMFCGKNDEQLLDVWSNKIIKDFELNNVVIAAIDDLECSDQEQISTLIENSTGSLALRVLQKIHLDELIIEGGATAFSVIKNLNMNQFFPNHEFITGVIRMNNKQDKKLNITVKPGSYHWPNSIWNFQKIKN